MHWVTHLLGLDNLSGGWYGFWSGIGGDASVLAIPLTLWRQHNCHVARCPRLGRHPVGGTGLIVCRRHHPDEHPTADDVLNAASAAADPASQQEATPR